MDYIKSPTYYEVYAYSVNGDRVKVHTTCHFPDALRKARQHQNWCIEKTEYFTNLPF